MLTRFESKLAGLGTAFLAVVLFSVTYMGSKAMQGQSQRPRRTVSELNYLRGNAKSPVRLQGLKIGNVEVNFSTMAPGREQPGKTVKPDEEFDADDDFLEKLSFETINVSEKRIVYIRFMVHLYSAGAVNRQSFDAAFAVDYGRPEIAGQGVAAWKIEPGGTATIRIPDSMIADVRKVVAGFKSPIVRVGVYVNMIDFEDGSGWTTGAGHRSGRVARNVLRRPAETAFSFGGASAFMGRGAVLQDEFGPCQDGCFNSGGTEVMSCDVLDQSCTGYRENRHNPDHPGPARSGTDTLRQTTLPIPCFSGGTPCSGKFGCTKDVSCRGGDGESDYCGSGSSCNPSPGELLNCFGSWDCGLCTCLWGSPILIDVQGNGYNLTNAANGVLFDLDGLGIKRRWSWTSRGSDDAF